MVSLYGSTVAFTGAPRMTENGLKDDSTLAPWVPFTEDKMFVIPKDKVIVISRAAKELASYYDVILTKLQQTKVKVKKVKTKKENKQKKVEDNSNTKKDNLKIIKSSDQKPEIKKIKVQETEKKEWLLRQS